MATTTVRTLMTTAINDNTTGDITPADLRGVFTGALDSIDTAALSQISGQIAAPTNRTYTIDLSAPYGYVINSLVTQTAAGTATVAIQINGTNVTGLSAVAVGTTLATTNATAANTVTAGQKVTMVVSAASGITELSYALRFTRT
jgi:hypothetical protein